MPQNNANVTCSHDAAAEHGHWLHAEHNAHAAAKARAEHHAPAAA
jgi:hypothetical protein